MTLLELASSTELPADAVVDAVHAELAKRIAAVEKELFAVVDDCRAERVPTLGGNIALVEELSARFQARGSSALRKVLAEIRVFLRLFEPYMVALRDAKSLHPCIAFDMVDARTGKASRAALPPMSAVAFASDMDKLLKKLAKARAALRAMDA